ncbi:Alkaline phosphatase like protein [Nitrospira tepida]|uniref:TVP38/TMEM64 family membrane protein n=1 Tax=Nitrospira tepida TaxID=2973512 RepID=A0AA86MXS5_9BACT|nr:TVP38/TMEM64 family protein [Nitrospira tepida]CAI4031001.1 Alkaline phosphatase like protein [Nitrospira tepida]
MTAGMLAVTGLPRTVGKWIRIGCLALTVAACWWLLSVVDYGRYLTPTVIVRWLEDAGPLAPLLLIVSMAGAVVIPPIPSLPLDLAAGAAFGPFFGTLYAVLGAEVGAIGAFFIARAVGREALSRYLKADAVFCQLCTDHQLMGLMFFARLIPVFSFDVVSYGAGLTNISLRTFALATLFGMIPPTFAFTYLGSSVVSAQWPLIVAGSLMVLFFLFMPKLLARHRASGFARLFLGPPPAAGPDSLRDASARSGRALPLSCAGCGVPLSER